jgi:biotin carboxyl carrier protein
MTKEKYLYVKKLVKLAATSGIDVETTFKGFHVKITVRPEQNHHNQLTVMITAPNPELPITSVDKPLPKQIEIRSNGVGTLICELKPGDKVKKGQLLFKISAMKIDNAYTMESPQDGIITQIEIESGVPVEFDQVIMIINPT